jgi:mRNA-degrading endonuclease toxin of MazEF toxin-antitoxin module
MEWKRENGTELDAGLESRSAAVQRAIRMLADPQLEADYATAWDEWEASGESSLTGSLITVVPLSSSISGVLPFQALLPSAGTGLPADAKARTEQIRPVSVARLGGVIGRVPPGLMAATDDAIRLHLQL